MTAELEFLPAALEIEQTPPLPVSRWILWSIMIFFALGVAWSCIGEINIVGVAPGKIVPSGRVKVVQPVEMGIVKAIHVEEGQRVAVGAVLVELDDTKARADLERLREEQRAWHWDRYRLQALVERLRQADADPPPATSAAPGAPGEVPAIVTARIAKDYTAYEAERQALTEESHRSLAERRETEQSIARLDAMIPLITERVQALGKLEKRALAARTDWLTLEQERVEQVKERDVLGARLAVADATQANLAERRAALRAQTEAGWLADLTEAENRIASYAQEIRKAETRLQEHRLTAPVAGTVQQLAVSTVGGVVTPAEKLMLIVPDEGALRIEAWVPNQDIGFVHDGQAAEIKIDTFPFTQYGTIDGEIETVSNDAIADEKLGLVYLAQVKMAKTTMWVKDKLVHLSPGMAVSVEVDMGKRRVIEFLMTPLLRYQDEGLRER